ncbi:hybrid sensor histidine kinase/response regulator [Erythrobacter tepidarius]|uniref:hybrid sensor histidine kinase/response regulator n=1 Tax=Erythrobacter tepidarius TaxID=60454 RepID=UPI000A35E33B|nr:hybrid sensor histidine kinase/response regulator [Erythrobacter tepidarius]
MRATESRVEFGLSGLFALLISGTLAYVHSLFEPLMPTARLWSWTGAMALVTGLMIVLPLMFFRRRPDAVEIARVWSPIGKVVAVLYDLAVAASVWVLLPYASEPLQLLMVIFYCAAISGQVIATAESIGTITFGVIAVFGSAALFFLNSETIYATSLAIFLLAFGGMMIGTALVLKRAIRSAVRQGLRAEAISQDLALALAETEAERDMRTRFIAAASHDLRQPLQAAILYFGQLQRANDPDRRARAEEGVERGLEEAMVMLEGMAEHLRLESGTLVADCRPVALDEVFSALALELAPAARRAGIDLRFARTARVVLADPALLTRILRNLVTNALVHSRGQRVRVLVRTRERIAIMVIDDGVGIAAESAPSMFLPYTQGTGAQRLGYGSGLGLAIASEMAHMMEGGLVLDARWASGCAFVLDLPAAAQPMTAARRGAACEPQFRLSGQEILLVEDRPDTRESLALQLRQHGAIVTAFGGSGEVAAALAEGLRPAAVITDWHLGPADSGAAVVAMVRAHVPEARIVVISGDATIATEREVAATGCRLLLKPASEPALLAAIAGVEGRR